MEAYINRGMFVLSAHDWWIRKDRECRQSKKGHRDSLTPKTLNTNMLSSVTQKTLELSLQILPASGVLECSELQNPFTPSKTQRSVKYHPNDYDSIYFGGPG